MEYTHRETIVIRGRDGEPQMDVSAEIVGNIVQDVAEKDGREFAAWFHHGFREVRMKMWDGTYRKIEGAAATAIYDAFCRDWTAQDVAEIYS